MKVGWKIFFAREPYNSPGTFVGPSTDFPDNLYEILVIDFRFPERFFLKKKRKSYDHFLDSYIIDAQF